MVVISQGLLILFNFPTCSGVGTGERDNHEVVLPIMNNSDSKFRNWKHLTEADFTFEKIHE